MHTAVAEKRGFDQISQSEGFEELSEIDCRRLDASGPTLTSLGTELVAAEVLEEFTVAAGGVAESGTNMEQDKRIRREIANSNERRRMQSINAGFQTLRSLLPQHEGEKLSKAAILQQTSNHIYTLEQEKTRLLTQNCQLKRLLGQQQLQLSGGAESDAAADSPASARRNASRESAEDPAGERPCSPPLRPPAADEEAAALRQQLAELHAQVEQERLQRVHTEERLRQAQAAASSPPPPAFVTGDYVHRLSHKKVKLEPGASPLHRPDSPPAVSGLTAPPAARILQELETHQLETHQLETDQLETHQLEAHQLETHQLETHQLELELELETQELEMETHHLELEPQQLVLESQELEIEQQELELEPQELELEPPEPPPPVMPHRPVYRVPTTSRQNLDTIVEAIRHLEGDHMFQDQASASEPAAAGSSLEPRMLRIEDRLEHERLALAAEPQEVPLELTTHARSSSSAAAADPYRPGVIVAQQPPPPPLHHQHHQHLLHHHLQS